MLSKLASKTHTLSRLIEQPALMRIKRLRGDVPLAGKLNQAWFFAYNIDLILDIGANVGTVTLTFAELLPHARIYAFEPLPDMFILLKKKTSPYANVCLVNIALGEKEENIEIHRLVNSSASSILTPSAWFESDNQTETQWKLIPVEVRRLDSYLEELTQTGCVNWLIKIDVQGFEAHVIRGGMQVISKANLIIIETLFQNYYQDQASFDQIYQLLTGLGFKYAGCIDQVASNDGTPAYQDALFIKK